MGGKVEWKEKGKYSADDKSPKPNKHPSYLRLYDRDISLGDAGSFSRGGGVAGRIGH